ncbi:putative membrane protein [Nocardia sp. GAS34]|uniref:hypothetical protein n=1 Tax=unclassified Nocardia TaxID=2637762 RepID=UPI003D1ADAA5
MSDSPQSAPGGSPGDRAQEQFTPSEQRGDLPRPATEYQDAGHGRHEMAGPAGYPQFEGPGAAQYGNEPVQGAPAVTAPPPPPPVFGAPVPVHWASGPVSAPPPGYGQPPPPGYGQPAQPGYGQPVGYAPLPGYPDAPGAVPPDATAAWPSGAAYPGTQPAGPPGVPPSVPPGAEAQPAPSPRGFPPPPPGELSVGRALGYGWERFRANPIPWISITLIGFVAYLAVTLVIRAGGVNSVVPLLLMFLVVAVVVWLLQAAMIRGALYETDGTPPDFQAFFGFVNAGNVLLVALGVFAASVVSMIVVSTVIGLVSTGLGTVLGVIAAMAVGFLCMFALHFVIDVDQSPVAAIRSSFRLVLANVGQLILLALAVLVLTAVATALCGIGLLVAGPVTVMALTYSYRTLTDGLTL